MTQIEQDRAHHIPDHLSGIARAVARARFTGVKQDGDKTALGMSRGLTDEMLRTQTEAANKYREAIPKTIEEQYAAAATPIKSQYANARTNMVGDLNRRGMLRSGHAQTKKAQLEADQYGALMGARGQVVQDVNNRQLALETDPLQGYANIQEQNNSFGNQLNDIQNSRRNFMSDLNGQSMGMIGSGLGTAAANYGKSYQVPNNQVGKP